ncbi:GntR family transcriptional regulator [Sabulilitoribacter multivorans]|uniref:GntR family transcriptional regulator n=1 Tax=Flaviramulus multivorans TaxID=1304750 RepID=A0ABS9ILN5_9FLAO|nr:GntR family transcriptional regulator [Flaviramulus multivorans]MCF7561516.1 GntR family transcriptional regulator [Flaviramulus multivorans]
MELHKFIKIDEDSRIPKYQQIVDSVIQNISSGNFKIDHKIPSINSLSEDLYLSRDTVEKAYSILKNRNIIASIRGKGYYISRTKLIKKLNILFLINKLSWYKMEIYHSFLNSIGSNAYIDLHIYHCDETLFLNLLSKHEKAYDYYVIMPHFKTEDLQHTYTTEAVTQALNKIPKTKLVLLDHDQIPIGDNVLTVYQDFENDIYSALKNGIKKIIKYKKIILIYPEKTVYPYPKRIKQGFIKFCAEHHLDFDILNQVYNDMVLLKGDLFITILEDDLVNLIEQIRDKEFVLGGDIGIVSYNDTPLKALLGITVISTDFRIMGETASGMILNNEKGKYKVPFNFIERKST